MSAQVIPFPEPIETESLTYIDEFGREQFAYCIEFRHGGRLFSFNIWAYSLEDAERRLKTIKRKGKLISQVEAVA